MAGQAKRRGSADETRERLILTARTVFDRDGYVNTDSNRIARAAGYSPATFYKHFADKREIFLAAYETWVTDEFDQLGAVVQAAKSTRALAAQLVRVVLEHHRRHPGFRASLRVLTVTDTVVRAFVLEKRRQQLERLALLRADLGLPRKTRGEDWALLLLMERVCDSIASDEARDLDVKESELVRALERAMEAHLG
jgi:AcrR family transcriptional regulator